MQPIITENREKIIELCRAHHVRRLAVFGSAVREDFDPTRSDVDLLVSFAASTRVNYAHNYFALQRSLTSVLKREVDLVIDGSVRNPYVVDNILDDVQVLYAA